MFSLIIDTSTEKGIVALAQGAHLVFNERLPSGLLNSRHLAPTIHSGFQALKIDASSLKYVAVGVGPGSFTGIRVGVAAALGIALPHGLPLIGFPSLLGFISPHDGIFGSVIDAKMQHAYCLIRERQEDVISHDPLELIPLSELKNKLTKCKGIFGPGKVEGIECQEIYPNAAHLVKVAEERFQRGEFVRDGKLDLIYREVVYRIKPLSYALQP